MEQNVLTMELLTAEEKTIEEWIESAESKIAGAEGLIADGMLRALIIKMDEAFDSEILSDWCEQQEMPVIVVSAAGTAGFGDLHYSGDKEEDPYGTAAKVAGQIAENAPVAVREIKKSMLFALKHDEMDSYAFEQGAFARTNSTEEKRMRMKRFLESQV